MYKKHTAHITKSRRGSLGISFVLIGALVSGFIGGSFIPALRDVFAFSGPPSSPGIGGGAILVDGGNNLSLGTSTVLSNTRLLIYSTSTESTRYAIRIFNKSEGPLFHVRNDGKVAIGTNTFGVTSTLAVAGEIQSTSGGFRFPDNSVQTTAASGGSTVNAANVEAGQFGANSGGGNFTFPASVGIGTTTPSAKLTVETGSIGYNSETGFLLLRNGSDSTEKLYFGYDNNLGTYGSGYIQTVKSGFVWLPTLINPSGGNVGVGTTVPTAVFHVQQANGGTGILLEQPSTHHVKIQINSSNQGLVGSTNATPVGLMTNGVFRVFADTAGNVGIGTTGPLAPLHVGMIGTNSKNEIAGIFEATGGDIVGTDRGVGIVFKDASNPTLVAGIAGLRLDSSATYNGQLAFFTNNSGGAPATTFAHMTERMRIDNAGNVGIGTASPSTNLHVVGGARITGLANCNTIDTNASGVLSCGTDETGSWVGGSGTSGYVARWIGPTTLGNSAIQDNGSRVGIGGAPDASLPLKVYGGAQIGGSVLPDIDSQLGRELGLSTQRWRGAHALNFYGTYNAGPDVAERYLSRDVLEPGDLVSKDTSVSGYWVKRATKGEEHLLMGIVSTAPGVILSEPQEVSNSADKEFSEKGFPIALVGRVPTKVSTENGTIMPGDMLTLSSLSGVAMKATGAGRTVGMALEGYEAPGVGRILVFVGGPQETGIASSENTAAQDGIEIKDKVTGDMYCIQIANGEFQKTKGLCE